MIKINNLTKIYKSQKSADCVALDNININLPDTGMVFIIGKSGSGKSTLLNLIGGLDSVTSGSINIDGNKIEEMKSKDFDSYRSSYLTFIFQDYKLFENLTVYQNCEVGLDINNSLDHEKIRKSIKKVGLEGYEKRYPYELSGGQQQRVAIARALARDSKLILADEPTGNLDFNTSRHILAILKEISKEKLIIIVSHNLMDADIYADRIIELHEGKIISDKVKRNNYYNSFKIEDDKIILPHYYDLNNVQKDKMLNAIKNNDIKEVIQNDNGFSDYEIIEQDINNVKFNSKKAKNRSLFKIFKMFLKKKFHSRIVMIIFSILLFTVLSVLQSFIMYEPNQTKVASDEDTVVLYKGNNLPYEDGLRTAQIHSIEDYELEGFYNIQSNAKIYKLNTYSVPITGYPQTVHMNTIALYDYNSYYADYTSGTLVCNEMYAANLLSIENKLEIICGNLYDKPYGVVITDYIADSMIFHNKGKTYEDLLGDYKYKTTSTFNIYINAIIKTDYKEKYRDIPKIYEEIIDEDTFYRKINQSKLLQDFVKDRIYKYDISYSFNPNFEKDVIDANIALSYYLKNYAFSYGDYMYNQNKKYSGLGIYDEQTQTSSKKYDIDKGEIVMSVSLFNNIFGTMYTTSNYDLSINNKVVLTLYNNADGKEAIKHSKEFKIIGVSSNTYFDNEDYKELMTHTFADYGLYFENNEYANDLLSYGNEHGFYLKTIDFESGLTINKMTSTFNTLFVIILTCIYVVFGAYIIIYGVNTVKSNKEEIGIYKALGGKFGNISKVLFIDVLLTGIIISVLSVFFTPFIINLADDIIVNSFKDVLNLCAVNIEIIKIYPGILALNYSLLNMLILVSAIVPTILLIRLKPIEIIKN